MHTEHITMDISAGDFITSILFTPEHSTNSIDIDIDNSINENERNSNGNNNNSNNNNETIRSSHDIKLEDHIHREQLHLLGLFVDEDDSSCIVDNTIVTRNLTDETNNNRFEYINGSATSFFHISDEHQQNSPSDFVPYDQKSQISWTTTNDQQNTDGAIYSFEIVSDNGTRSELWPDTNRHRILSDNDRSPVFVVENNGDDSGARLNVTNGKPYSNDLISVLDSAKKKFSLSREDFTVEDTGGASTGAVDYWKDHNHQLMSTSSSTDCWSANFDEKDIENDQQRQSVTTYVSISEEEHDKLLTISARSDENSKNIVVRQIKGNLLPPANANATTSPSEFVVQEVTVDEDYSENSTTNLLLRNALLGKTPATSRYQDKFDMRLEPDQQQQQNRPLLVNNNSNEFKSLFCDDKPDDKLLIIPSSLDFPNTIDEDNPSSVLRVTGSNHSLNIFDTDALTVSSASSSPQIDEIFLPSFDSFNYTDEQLSRINQDLAQTIQQICNANSNHQTPQQQQQPSHVNNYISFLQPDDTTATVVDINLNEQTSPAVVIKNSKRSLKRSVKAKAVCGVSADADTTSHSTNEIGGPTPNGVTSIAGTATRKERSLHHCFVCNKGFKDKYSVNVHIRTHTGEKPFSCMVCNKRFRQKAHLAKHQHTHFQKKTLPPSPTSILSTSSSSVLSISTSTSSSAIDHTVTR